MQQSDLLQAIRENQIQLVDGILQMHSEWLNEPDDRGSTPLLLATYYTALMGVCFKHHNQIAKLLVEAGADIHLVNHQGANAIIYCAMFKNEELASYLLEKGAKKNHKDEDGLRATDHAKLKGAIDLAKLLA